MDVEDIAKQLVFFVDLLVTSILLIVFLIKVLVELFNEDSFSHIEVTANLYLQLVDNHSAIIILMVYLKQLIFYLFDLSN